MSAELEPPLIVDGPRPGFTWLTSFPIGTFTAGEFSVMFALVADSYDGHRVSPSISQLAQWAHMERRNLQRVLRGLSVPNSRRTAVIAIIPGKAGGRVQRNTYVFLSGVISGVISSVSSGVSTGVVVTPLPSLPFPTLPFPARADEPTEPADPVAGNMHGFGEENQKQKPPPAGDSLARARAELEAGKARREAADAERRAKFMEANRGRRGGRPKLETPAGVAGALGALTDRLASEALPQPDKRSNEASATPVASPEPASAVQDARTDRPLPGVANRPLSAAERRTAALSGISDPADPTQLAATGTG